MDSTFNKENTSPSPIDKLLNVIGVIWRVILAVFFVAALPNVAAAVVIAILFIVSLLVRRWRRKNYAVPNKKNEQQEQIKTISDLSNSFLSFCKQVETDDMVLSEFERHHVVINGPDGRPLCGEGRELHSAIIVDVAHCYDAVLGIRQISSPAENIVISMMVKMLDRQDMLTPLPNGLYLIRKEMLAFLEAIISQSTTRATGSVGDYGFIVASILANCDKSLASTYLDYLYRLSDTLANAKNVPDERQQAFLRKIRRMQEKLTKESDRSDS